MGSLLALHSSFWGLQFKAFCNPVLSCHSCALSWFACPIGVLVHYAGYRVFPLLAAGTLLLAGVLIGRLLCGWVCPFGYLQDLLHKLPTRKLKLPAWTNRIKYVVLVLMVFALPFWLGESTRLSFCRICPAAAIQVTLPAMLRPEGMAIGIETLVKLFLLAGVLILAVFSSRSFCRVLCPIGALLAPANHVSLWAVRTVKGRCISCAACDRVCPTDVQPSERLDRGVDANRHLDCVVCHDCTNGCKVPHPKG